MTTKKKHNLKKISFRPTLHVKLPIEVDGKKVKVSQTLEIPMWVVLNSKFRSIGLITNEELQKFESEYGELQVLEGEAKVKQVKKGKKDEHENQS